MAKQFQATVQGQSVAFPSSRSRIVQYIDASVIEYNGASYFADETVSDLVDLANTSGTEQVQATIIRVNDGVQTTPLVMGFPASLISIYPSSVSGANSVIIFNNDFYYAEESETDLVDAANAGGGGGSSLLPTTGTGTATGDIIGILAGHILSISEVDAVGPYFSIDPSTFLSRLLAIDQSDLEDLAASSLTLTADKIGDGGVKIAFSSLYNGGATEIIIDGKLKTISLAADNGIFFNDFINLNVLQPPDPQDGDIWREDNTLTGLKYRVNGETKTIVLA